MFRGDFQLGHGQQGGRLAVLGARWSVEDADVSTIGPRLGLDDDAELLDVVAGRRLDGTHTLVRCEKLSHQRIVLSKHRV